MTNVIELSKIEAYVRDLTDDEVASYEEHGWAMLTGLIEPELAGELLRMGEEWHEREGVESTGWTQLAIGAGVEPFRSFATSETMGRNAERLIARRRLNDAGVAIRYRSDHFVLRPGPSEAGTTYHQDSAEHGSDRVGDIQFWIALAEVTPEMGGMRFVTGSHREGPLGTAFGSSTDLLEQYPKLLEHYELSPQFHYQPGDATVHHGYTIHGAPPNATDRPRLSYILSYVPADSRWWNGTQDNWGSGRTPLSDETNPVVYPRA